MLKNDGPAFISYSRSDSEFAMRLAGDLKAAEAKVWLDKLDISPGQRWDQAVETALNRSSMMLVILSSTSVQSNNVLDEVSFALEEGKAVIPLLIADCPIPFRLRRIQHVDFKADYAHGLTMLLEHFGVQPTGKVDWRSVTAAYALGNDTKPVILHSAGETSVRPYRPGDTSTILPGAPLQDVTCGPMHLDLEPFTRMGKYQVLAKIAQGGMGAVYRGEDTQIGREVVIKVLNFSTPWMRERFTAEARFGSLNHPNIVTIYDFGEQDGNPYIVLEMVNGETLDELMRQTVPMSLDHKLEIISQVCDGLSYAHEHGVIHCDIKPGNIMVRTDGRVKILDFGIARLQGEPEGNVVVGTPMYISPERFSGHPISACIDVWALGVTLYELLTGTAPFVRDVPDGRRIAEEPFLPLGRFMDHQPAALNEVMERTLAHNADARYQSTNELAAALQAILAELRLNATPPRKDI